MGWGGVASVAIETGGQRCWILLPGRRGRLPPSEGRQTGVARQGRVNSTGGLRREQSEGWEEGWRARRRHGSLAEPIIFISGGAADDDWIDSLFICNQWDIC